MSTALSIEFTSDVITFNRAYLACFYTFVALFYTTRILYLKRVTHTERVFHGSVFSANWWHHKIFDVFRVWIWLTCVIRYFYPSVDQYLGLLPALSADWVILAGTALLTTGFAWAIATHFMLGRCWTSGINQQGPTRLVTNGVYGISRNPIYLGVLASQVGFFFALPSLFSLLCLAVGVITILRQTSEEERHLAQQFPDTYRQYQNAVPRWL
ncbi:MAG: isoprenylcysteine carboxylmethyltransferase family protein [Marinomonas sp.]|nr:MAG: isoprenylcysteine carboxylmethyltransferase family protein [Marinomonas sp.]RUM55576.1 MAG: isoprenylcysteine carboxylmethyltransferase family protein [Marinomonas sp.]